MVLALFLSSNGCGDKSSTSTQTEPSAIVADKNSNNGSSKAASQNSKAKKSSQTNQAKKSDRNIPTTNNQDWTQQDEQKFMEFCLEKIKENPQFEGEKYCSCLKNIMQDKYAPTNYKQAVKEHGKAVARCLTNARIE